MENGNRADAADKKQISTLYLVLVALFTALVYVVTMFANIPAAFLGAGGNINLGDSVIMLAAIILGPLGGAVSGALGATLADITGGWLMYAPFTAIIKAASGFLCGLLFRGTLKNKPRAVKKTLAILCACAVVIVGYFFAEVILLSAAGAPAAAAWIAALRTIVPNLIQTLISGVICFIVLPKLPDFRLFKQG